MRVTGNLFFRPKTIFRGPTKGVNSNNSGISKLPKYYVDGTLNLCREMPELMQKESAEPDTLLGENAQNVPKYWAILEFSQISKMQPQFVLFFWVG